MSTEYVYKCSATESSCEIKIEERKTEAELYWDLGMVVGYTFVFAIIYLFVWMIKFVIQLMVAKKAFKIISVKGKSFFITAFGDKGVKDMAKDEEDKNNDDDRVTIISLSHG